MTRRDPVSSHRTRAVGAAVTALAAVVIAVATLTPTSSAVENPPFGCVVCGSDGGVDAVANVLLFVPFGVGLALRGTRARRALAGMVATTVMIELLQLRLVVGRDTSLGDLLWNAAGGALGYWATREWRRLVWPSTGAAGALALGWAAAWAVGTTTTAWSVASAFPPGRWVAHVGAPRPVPGRTPDVRSATIGGRPLRTGWLPRSDEVRALLLAGAPLEAVAVVPAAADGPVNVVVIDDGDTEQQMALLRRTGDDASVYLRTRAAALRLRSPSVALAGAFATPGAPTQLRVWREGPRMHVEARSAAGAQRRTVSLGPNWGWSLLLPPRLARVDWLPWYAALWVAALVAPLAYWGARAARAPGAPRVVGWVAASVPPLAFVLLPRAFDVAPVPATEWAAWAVGAALGAGAAAAASRRTRLLRAVASPELPARASRAG